MKIDHVPAKVETVEREERFIIHRNPRPEDDTFWLPMPGDTWYLTREKAEEIYHLLGGALGVKTTVWVLQDEADYYGPDFVGVYSSKEAAQKAAAERTFADGKPYPLKEVWQWLEEVELDLPAGSV